MSLLVAIGSLMTLVCLNYFWHLKRARLSPPFPPGPPRDPIIGHLRYMPTSNRATVFHEWAKTYGDVMYLDILGKPSIVLNTARVAVDLLNKRSSIYSDRPRFASYDLTGWSTTLSLMPYGKRFKAHRQLHQSWLNRQKCHEFRPMQTLEARALVDNLLASQPAEYSKMINRFSTSVIAQVVAGHQIRSDDDPYMQTTQALMESLGRSGAPGTTQIDMFPFLKYLPSWCRVPSSVARARDCEPILRRLYEFPLSTVRKQMENGVAKPSFLQSELSRLEDGMEIADHADVRWAGAAMFGSTVWSCVTVFILAMLLHPEYQEKVQRELNEVIGPSRLPTFEDREHLPLVECIMQETLRWHPPTELGVPHRLMKDDIYEGMFIPEGSTVFANIRAMSLDESIYASPETFFPERFLPAPAGKNEPQFASAYGFGRRICTGQHLGDQSLWIAIASILAACRISNVKDKDGNPVVPDASMIMSEGVSSHPNEFPYLVSPRNSEVRALLAESVN
ncbi:cytochrome P450 [Mycena filopes]|nr:cytochrome P450 [Mycena filopes]